MIVFTIGVFCNPLGEVVGGWENVTVSLEHYFVKTLKQVISFRCIWSILLA